MAVLDLKKEYLTNDETKDYTVSLKLIATLESEIETRKITIDQLRSGIEEINKIMFKRHLDFMLNKKN